MFGHYSRNLVVATPFTLVVPVLYWWLGATLGFPFTWQSFTLGIAGWLIALALRVPCIWLFAHMGIGRNTRAVLTILLSGPAEESVRALMVLVLLGVSRNAFAAGLGWATIEVWYGVIQGFTLRALSQRTDAKARQTRALLEAQGMGRSMQPDAPLWGIAERVSATAGHVGFTLLLASNPLFVLFTAPIHSAANLTIVKLMRHSFLVAELAAAAVFLAVFVAGLLLALA